MLTICDIVSLFSRQKHGKFDHQIQIKNEADRKFQIPLQRQNSVVRGNN